MNQSWKKIIQFSLPMTFIGLADIILIYMSLFWAGIFINDVEALAAIRVSGSVVMIIEVVLLAVAGALLIFISQSVGAKNLKQAKKGITQANTLTLFAGIGITVLGFLLYPYLIRIFDVTASTAGYMEDYLLVFFLGYIPVALNNLLLALPRYFQNLKLVYRGLAVLLISNAISTPSFMYLFDQLGLSLIGGAALGVICANLICSVFMMFKLFVKDALEVGLSGKSLLPVMDFQIVREQKMFIFSQVANNITFNLSSFLYIIILSYYPADVLNVYTIGVYMFAALGLFFQNFIGSIIPIVAQYKGANEIENINDIVWQMFKIVAISGGGIALAFILFRNQIASWISVSEELTSTYAEFLLIYSIPWLFNLLSMIFVLTISGSGDAKGGLYLIISNMYVLSIVPLLIIPRLFDDVIQGVFITLAIINLFTFVNSLGYYLLGKWRKASLIQPEAVGS